MRIIIIISLNVHSRPLIHRYDTEREREVVALEKAFGPNSD